MNKLTSVPGQPTRVKNVNPRKTGKETGHKHPGGAGVGHGGGGYKPGLTLGTAACKVNRVMSLSVVLEAMSVAVTLTSVCLSQRSLTVTPFCSYTVTPGSVTGEGTMAHLKKPKTKQTGYWNYWSPSFTWYRVQSPQ